MNNKKYKKSKLKIYTEYFKYVMEHKKNVFKVCWKKKRYNTKLLIHAFTHDLSKLRPSEFIPYAEWFYGDYGTNIDKTLLTIPEIKEKHDKYKENFDKAWKKHYKRNKHHWNHWIGRKMPIKYIDQMICDWEGMSIKFGNSAQEFYMKNYDKIEISLDSRVELEYQLRLIDEGCLCSGITWKDYCERMKKTMEQDLRGLGYIK